MTSLAVAIGGLYWLLSSQLRSADAKKEKSSLLFSDMKREDFLALTLRVPVVENQKPGENEIQLKRLAEGKDQWIVTSVDKNYPADTGAVNGIISTILSARSESRLSDVDLREVKLEPEKMALEIETKSGKKKILLGEDTPTDYYVYARVEGESQVILTSRSLRFGVDKKISDLRQKNIFEIAANEVKSLKLTSSGREDLSGFTKIFMTQAAPNQWSAEEPFKVGVETREVESFIEALSKTTVKNFYSEDLSEKKKLSFSWPLVTIEIEKNSADSKKSIWKLVSLTKPNAPKEKIYLISEEGKESVYEVSESFKNLFRLNFFRFRPKTITKLAKNEINHIQIQRGDIEIVLSQSANKWNADFKTPSKSYSGPARQEQVDLILGKLSDIEALQYLDTWDSRRLGLDAPSAIVNLQRKSGESSVDVANLFFGKKIDATQIVIRKENMEAAAGVSFDLEYYLPTDAAKFLEKIPELDSKGASKDIASSSESKKESIMLQPTVSDLKSLKKLPASIVKPGHKYRAIITTVDGKIIEAELAAAEAPYTVSNFIHLARNHFYDGVKFHRVIPDFVIQGGDPTGTGGGGPGYKFDNEDNNLKHLRGSFSMAHAGRNTNGSQFFIVLKPQTHLDGVHTVFGKVTKGENILDTIKPGDTMKKVEVFEDAL